MNVRGHAGASATGYVTGRLLGAVARDAWQALAWTAGLVSDAVTVGRLTLRGPADDDRWVCHGERPPGICTWTACPIGGDLGNNAPACFLVRVGRG